MRRKDPHATTACGDKDQLRQAADHAYLDGFDAAVVEGQGSEALGEAAHSHWVFCVSVSS